VVVRTGLAEADDGTRLMVRSRPGDPSLPVFVLVHGLASNARLWDEVAEGLAAADHASHAVDLRGHGESEKPDRGYDFATVSADVAAVVRDVAERRAILVGQSWGANVVMETAARFPEMVKAVACIDGGYIRLSEAFADWDAAREALAPPPFGGLTSIELQARASEWFPGFPDAGVAAQLANFETLDDGSVRPRLTRERHMTIVRHLWDHDPDAVAASVDVPVWVMAAKEGWPGKDERVSRFVGALASSRVEWVDGHHDLHAEQPLRVVDFLLDLAAEVSI
jgi:pimeloyl-ACP methyl ester carboxylesterase